MSNVFKPKHDLFSFRNFLREKVAPGMLSRDAANEFPENIITKLHELGYLQAFVPSELGGAGFTTVDMIWLGREVSYVSRGLTCILAANMLSLVPILSSGSAELRDEVLDDILAYPSIGAFCFTEPDAGSDILAIKTTATRVPGGYRLSGQKCFITNASYATHFVVMAKIVGIEHPKDAITAFYVPRGAKGLSTGKPLEKLGHRESNTSEVFFDEIFIPEKHRIGAEGKGLSVAVRSLQRSRTFFAASAVGLCDRARDLAAQFLNDREHFGKALLQQPQIRNTLAQLETEARAAWCLSYAAAEAWDAGNVDLHHSSMAKMYSGQIAMKYASTALELFGGWGYTREFEIECLFRDAKLLEIIEGPTFVQQSIIAKEILSPWTTNTAQNSNTVFTKIIAKKAA